MSNEQPNPTPAPEGKRKTFQEILRANFFPGLVIALIVFSMARSEQQFDNLSARMGAMESQMGTISTRIDNQSSRIDSLYDKLSARMDNLSSRIDNLEEHLSDRIDRLYTILVDFIKEVTGIREDTAVLKTEQQQIREELDQHKETHHPQPSTHREAGTRFTFP